MKKKLLNESYYICLYTLQQTISTYNANSNSSEIDIYFARDRKFLFFKPYLTGYIHYITFLLSIGSPLFSISL